MRLRIAVEKLERRVRMCEEFQDRMLGIFFNRTRPSLADIPDARPGGSAGAGFHTAVGPTISVKADMVFHTCVYNILDAASQQCAVPVDELVRMIVYKSLGYKDEE